MKKNVLIALTVLVMLVLSCNNPASTDDADSGVTIDAANSDYRVIIDVESDPSTYGANARVYDGDNNFVNDVIIKVDGIALEKMSFDGYSSSIGQSWEDGSEHTFSVKIPGAEQVTGNIVKPTGTLTGITYNPSKPTIADSYTLTAPTNGWPTGSFIHCSYEKGGSQYGYYSKISGTSDIVINPEDLSGATEVTFKSMLKNEKAIEGYASGSVISVTGTETEW